MDARDERSAETRRTVGLCGRGNIRGTVRTLRSVGFKLGRWVDSVLMERPLGNGDATLPDALT